MKLLTLLGIVFLAALPSVAKADGLRIELGVSKSRQSVAGDNIWYDANGGYPYRNYLHPWGLQVGASNDWNSWLGWRATAVYMGHTRNGAVWPEDEDYFEHEAVTPKYAGRGSGDAFGVTLAPTLNYRPWEHWQLSAEGGLFLYTARWREQVAQITAGGSQISPWTNAATFASGVGWHTDYTPYIGFTARYSDVFASYRKYRDVYAVDSVFGNAASQITVGLSFPIR